MLQKKEAVPLKGVQPSAHRARNCIPAVAWAWEWVAAMGTQHLLASGKERDVDGKNVRFKVQVGD